MELHLLKRLDFRSLKRTLTKKLWALFRSTGRAQRVRDQVSHLANDLEAACKRVEPEFMQIGHELQAVYRDATELTDQVLYSINLIGGREGEGVLSQLRGIAEQSLAELESCQESVSEKAVLIKAVMAHLGSLSGILPLVEKVGRLLRIVAVNIGIETARSNESKELFSVVAQETRKLSCKIEDTCEVGLDLLKKSQDTQRSLHGDLSGGLKEINRMGEDARRIVQEAIREIEKLMASTIQAAEQAGERSSRISKQVGNLVVAVQFHDSMSQRVEHIIKALVDVEHLLAGEASGKGDVDHKKRLSHVASIVNLQSAQLKGVIAEIGRVHGMAVRSFEEIIRQLEVLFTYLSDLSSSSEQNQSREGSVVDPFERLRSSFIDLNDVLHQGQVLMDPVRHAASQASDTVEQVSGIVQEIYTIGFETHLMALNAIVKTAHLGSEGHALEVLAQEVKKSSDQGTSIMGRTDQLLGSITDATNKLRERSPNTEDEVSLKGVVEQITQAYDSFMESSALTTDRANEIRQAISKTKAGLDFMPLLAEKLTGSLTQLETISSDLTSFTHGEHPLSREETGHILGRYTMEKEREVHEECVLDRSVMGAKRTISEPLRYADEKSEKREGGTKDNIELLTRDASGHSDEPFGKSGKPDKEPVLFRVNEPEETREGAGESLENETTRENEEDLGDNVELF